MMRIVNPGFVLLALVACVCFSGSTSAQADRRVVVSFVVEVPADTPDEAVVHVSGSDPALGSWSGQGLELQRGEDGKYRGRVGLSDGQEVAYKFTLGSWATVEKRADGAERENRALRVGDTLGVVAAVERWHDGAPAVSTVTGELRLHTVGGNGEVPGRAVRVWLPPGYEDAANGDRRYPVLVMHDGQNLFDVVGSALGAEWRVDEAATALIGAGAIEPVIVVGIDNAGGRRMREYVAEEVTVPRGGSEEPEDAMSLGGGGDTYAAWVVGRVLPVVREAYRTREGAEHTATAGSSLGGVIALHLVRSYPEEFGAAAALSPALWIDEAELVEAQGDALPAGARYWLDMGTEEGGGGANAQRQVRLVRALADRLTERGADVGVMIVPGAVHSESAWAARFGDVLTFLYAVERPK